MVMVCNVSGAKLFLEGHIGRLKGNRQVTVREIMIRHKEKLFQKKMIKHWIPGETVESPRNVKIRCSRLVSIF